jgi:hypothetical protein
MDNIFIHGDKEKMLHTWVSAQKHGIEIGK